ncbi:MAG: hypothetical protein ABI315_01020 [Bacteroidia bacterium]
MVKHKQLYISNNTQNKNSYFYTDLIEDDIDSGNTSEKEKYAFEKNTLVLGFSLANPFISNNAQNDICFNRYFLNFAQPYFIYFRALRL